MKGSSGEAVVGCSNTPLYCLRNSGTCAFDYPQGTWNQSPEDDLTTTVLLLTDQSMSSGQMSLSRKQGSLEKSPCEEA